MNVRIGILIVKIFLVQIAQDLSFKIQLCSSLFLFLFFFFFLLYHHQRTDRGEVVLVVFTFKLNEGNLLLNWQIHRTTQNLCNLLQIVT